MKHCLIFLFLGFNLIGLGQTSGSLATDPLFSIGNSPAFYQITKTNIDVEVEGSIYLDQHMKPGKIKMYHQDKFITDLTLRYNVFKDQIEVKKKEVGFIAINSYIEQFEVENESSSQLFSNAKSLGGGLKGFVRLVYKGAIISVYAKHIKKKKTNDSSQPYSSFRDYVEYVDFTDYYFYKMNDRLFIPIKTKKKLLTDFPQLANKKGISKGKLKDEDFLAELAKTIEKPD